MNRLIKALEKFKKWLVKSKQDKLIDIFKMMVLNDDEIKSYKIDVQINDMHWISKKK